MPENGLDRKWKLLIRLSKWNRASRQYLKTRTKFKNLSERNFFHHSLMAENAMVAVKSPMYKIWFDQDIFPCSRCIRIRFSIAVHRFSSILLHNQTLQKNIQLWALWILLSSILHRDLSHFVFYSSNLLEKKSFRFPGQEAVRSRILCAAQNWVKKSWLPGGK